MKPVSDIGLKKQSRLKYHNTHNSMKFALVLANCFALLPVEGAVHGDVKHLKFRWKSFKILYTIVTLLAAGFTLGTGIIYLFKMCSFEMIVEYVFYINWTISVLVFLLLSRNWPHLIREWVKVDEIMEKHYSYPPNLNKRLKITTMVVVVFSIVEYGLSIGSHISNCRKINNGRVNTSLYYEERFPNFFTFVEYNVFLACFIQTVSVMATVTWNFNDLFIILISTALALRFQQIAIRLEHFEKKQFNMLQTSVKEFSVEIREDYDRLCNLCRLLDRCLSLNVLTSFACNLFFILVQLFNTLKIIEDGVQKVYFFYSFAFLIFRTVAVSLYAAWINDESKVPAGILNSIPSSMYDCEIRRFLLQISFDNVALTGSKMFKVTRGLILKVAGAIVTYELVLIQFNSSNVSHI